MAPNVDLVIVVRTLPQNGQSKSKPLLYRQSQEAERQYARMVRELKGEGLKVTSRGGDDVGTVLVFVGCTDQLLKKSFSTKKPASVDRIQLAREIVHNLGIVPKSVEWNMVGSILCLHDSEFNSKWIRAWTSHRAAIAESKDVSNADISDQFGPHIALYFTFLKHYTKFLVYPAAFGLAAYLINLRYSSLYLIFITVWSSWFIENWHLKELEFNSRYHHTQKVTHQGGFSVLRSLSTVPFTLFSAATLFFLLTSIFIFEAFITKLYTGPGQSLAGLAPTLLFVGLVPKFMAAYKGLATKMTAWELGETDGENFDDARTKKVFAMSTLVAYLGLALSAFVYIPHGDDIMRMVLEYFIPNADADVKVHAMLKTQTQLNPKRLEEQMFAYTVTNQISGTFIEVGLPFVLRAVDAWRNNKKSLDDSPRNSASKRVVFADERPLSSHERSFLDDVKRQVALPEYSLFEDYNEMVTQFGYVAMWSTVWPLAPLMALVNNVVEQRSDAFKIVTHARRPMPVCGAPRREGKGYRAMTEGEPEVTIGPWLFALKALGIGAWVVNSALAWMYGTLPLGNIYTWTLFAGSGVCLVVASRNWLRDYLAEGLVVDVNGNVNDEVDTSEDWNKEGDEWREFWDVDEGVDEIRRVMKEA